MKFRCSLLFFAACLVLQTFNAASQITTRLEAVSNAGANAQMLRSNADAKAIADAEYLRLHPALATNSLSQHRLELLDITSDRTARSNYFSKPHSTQELEELTNTVNLFLTNAAAQSSYYFHISGMTEPEYESNLVYAMSHAPPPKSWPEPSERQDIFQRCAVALRSAIDTNQVEWVCSNMAANQPAIREFQNQTTKDGPITVTFVTNVVVISHVRNFSRLAISNLDEFASLLKNPNLKSFVGGPGYEGQISDSTNYYLWLFWPDNMVRSIEKRTADGQRVLVCAGFYENGKLQLFKVVSPPESITFDTNGKFASYHGIENNMLMDLRPDETGSVKVRGFLLQQ